MVRLAFQLSPGSRSSTRFVSGAGIWREVAWRWPLFLVVILGLAGCQSWDPKAVRPPRGRINNWTRMQRRRAEAYPDAVQATGTSPIGSPGFRQITARLQDAAPRPSESPTRSKQIEECFGTATPIAASAKLPGDTAWTPKLLIRANDNPLHQVSESETSKASESGFGLEPLAQANQEDRFEATPEPAWQWQPEVESSPSRDWNRWSKLGADYQNFYATESLLRLGTAFVAGAAMANTNFDEMISHDLYRENVIEIANEDISEKLHQPKALGDGYILLPTLAGLALAEPWLERSEWTRPLGEWGDRGARAVLVGGPVVLLTQNLTGASRPNESPSGSHWEPFQDNNGVSGHAFVGAIPFLTAGRMSRNPWAKAAWYGASTLPALSRVNDERHYFSQVFLGWYIAWLATAAVDNSERDRRQFKVLPTWSESGPGLMLEKHF